MTATARLLVDSRPTYNVVLSNEPLKKIDVNDRVDDYANGLELDRQFVVERLNLIKKQNEFETMVLKENATCRTSPGSSRTRSNFPELRVELQPQRFYPLGTTLAHVLGYVGEISPKQLESPTSTRTKAFGPATSSAKAGLSSITTNIFAASRVTERCIVDSRGRVQSEIEVVPPQSGQDLVTTIDLDLQNDRRAAAREFVDKTRHDHRDGPEQRRDLRDGIGTVVRPEHFRPAAARRPRAASRSPHIGRTKNAAL